MSRCIYGVWGLRTVTLRRRRSSVLLLYRGVWRHKMALHQLHGKYEYINKNQQELISNVDFQLLVLSISNDYQISSILILRRYMNSTLFISFFHRPCRSFCTEVRSACEPALKQFNYLWPEEEVNCNNYSDEPPCFRPWISFSTNSWTDWYGDRCVSWIF